jgi:hypothetical protein
LCPEFLFTQIEFSNEIWSPECFFPHLQNISADQIPFERNLSAEYFFRLNSFQMRFVSRDYFFRLDSIQKNSPENFFRLPSLPPPLSLSLSVSLCRYLS